jgi:hypothetical protein
MKFGKNWSVESGFLIEKMGGRVSWGVEVFLSVRYVGRFH